MVNEIVGLIEQNMADLDDCFVWRENVDKVACTESSVTSVYFYLVFLRENIQSVCDAIAFVVCEKKHCIQTFTKFSKSKKGHNSVKVGCCVRG